VAEEDIDPNDVRVYADQIVRTGFYDRTDAIDAVVAYFEEEMEASPLKRLANSEVDKAIRALREAEAAWPPLTDCDRLDLAFEKLEDAGIVARQHFTCCGTCGVAEMGAEVSEAEARGLKVRGYVFFHQQDTDSAVEGHGLYLNYGAIEDGEPKALAVGREIVAAIESCGLKTNWDGSWDKRIGVTLEWRKRFPTL
jgi:hypothetical protein